MKGKQRGKGEEGRSIRMQLLVSWCVRKVSQLFFSAEFAFFVVLRFCIGNYEIVGFCFQLEFRGKYIVVIVLNDYKIWVQGVWKQRKKRVNVGSFCMQWLFFFFEVFRSSLYLFVGVDEGVEECWFFLDSNCFCGVLMVYGFFSSKMFGFIFVYGRL